MDVAVCRESFRIWKQSWNEEDRKKYCEAKKYVKTVVYMAMDQKTQEAVEKVDLRVNGLSCLELPNKVLEKRKMLFGLNVLEMKVGQ